MADNILPFDRSKGVPTAEVAYGMCPDCYGDYFGLKLDELNQIIEIFCVECDCVIMAAKEEDEEVH